MNRADIIKKNRNEWFDKACKYKAELDGLKAENDSLEAWKICYQSKIKEVKKAFDEMKVLYETVKNARAEDRKELASTNKVIDRLTAELRSANDGVAHGNEVFADLTAENVKLKNKLAYIRKRCPEIDEMEQALKGNPNDR